MLFFVIRPLVGVVRRARRGRGAAPRRLLAWFGVRGIGSVYYAVYFAEFELRDAVATEVAVRRVHGDRRIHHPARNFRRAAHGAVPRAARALRRRGPPVSDK